MTPNDQARLPLHPLDLTGVGGLGLALRPSIRPVAPGVGTPAHCSVR
jgi:hypothetical protein